MWISDRLYKKSTTTMSPSSSVIAWPSGRVTVESLTKVTKNFHPTILSSFSHKIHRDSSISFHIIESDFPSIHHSSCLREWLDDRIRSKIRAIIRSLQKLTFPIGTNTVRMPVRFFIFFGIRFWIPVFGHNWQLISVGPSSSIKNKC